MATRSKIPRTRRIEPSSVSQEDESVPCQSQHIDATLRDSSKLQVEGITVDGPIDATDSDPSVGKQLIVVCIEPPGKTVDQGDVVTSTLDKSNYQSYSYSYSYSEIFYTLLAIGSYVFDVGSDIYVAFVYHSEGEWWWFALTVSFVVIPSFIISCFSLAWYIQDHKTGNKVHPIRWIPRLFMLFLQLGPLIRYIDTMIFGLKSKWAKIPEEQKKLYKHKTWEETDSALLRLLECFMEAAPQLTLQLYILAMQGSEGQIELSVRTVGQIISCITSLGSISYALAAYQRALRESLDDKAKINWSQLFLIFFWHLFTVGARVLALALFASYFHWWAFVVIGGHWVIMLVWILFQRTQFCASRFHEIIFDCVAAAVHIFDFFNLIEGHTRLRCFVFYALVCAENTAMILLWFFYQSLCYCWYVYGLLLSVFVLFFVGIAFQLFYYLICHPNNEPPYRSEKRIKLCIPCGEMIDCRLVGRSKGSIA